MKRRTHSKAFGTPSIAVGLSTYQDYDSLPRCISSFVDKVDLVISIYGRYLGFGGCHHEDPEKEEIHRYLKSFDNVVTVDLDPASQVAKRNKYLEVAGQYKIDIVLVIDSDEWIEERDGGFDDFRKRATKELQQESDGLGFIHNLYGIWERYGSPDQLQHNPRVILRPEQCEYFNHHNWIRNKSRGYRLWMEPPFSNAIVLRGDNDLRTPERERIMDTYEAFQSVCDEQFT